MTPPALCRPVARQLRRSHRNWRCDAKECQPQRRRRLGAHGHEQPPGDGREGRDGVRRSGTRSGPAQLRHATANATITWLGLLDTSLKTCADISGQITVSLTSRINTRRPRHRSPAAEKRYRSRSSAIMPQNILQKSWTINGSEQGLGARLPIGARHAAATLQAVSGIPFSICRCKPHGGRQQSHRTLGFSCSS